MRSFVLLALLISFSVQAEIFKLALPEDSGMKFYWWPVLPKIKGWNHDRNHSLHYKANAQAPEGYTFSNAETVIYARAIFKPKVPNLKDLESFIADDQTQFISLVNAIVTPASSIKTSDGISLVSFTFFPKEAGNWEQVTYGEEGEFYLIFTISSRSKNGFENARSSYEEFIRKYKM